MECLTQVPVYRVGAIHLLAFAYYPGCKHRVRAVLTTTMRIAKTAVVCVMLLVLAGCFDDSKFRRIVLSVDVSPSGDLAAVRYAKDGVETIELSSYTRKCHWTVGGGLQVQGIAAFSSSGKLIAVGKEQMGPALTWGTMHRIFLYDPATCDRVRTIPLGDFSEGHVLQFSPDDSYMAVASKRWLFRTGVNLAIIEVESGRTTKKWTYLDAEYPSLSLSDDGTLLAFGFVNLNSKTDDRHAKNDNDTGTVLLLDFPTGDEKNEWREEEGNGVVAVDIASDNETVALGLKDGTVKLVHYPTAESRVLHKFDSMVVDMQFSPSNEFIFSSDSRSNGSLISHQTHTGEPVHNYVVESPIFDFDLTDDGKSAVIGTSSGEIETVDLGESPTTVR